MTGQCGPSCGVARHLTSLTKTRRARRRVICADLSSGSSLRSPDDRPGEDQTFSINSTGTHKVQHIMSKNVR